MQKTRYIILIGLLLSLFGCLSEPSHPTIRELFARTPAKRLASYSFNPETKLAERVMRVPDFVLDYLKTMDGVDSYAPYSMSESESTNMNEYLSLLPEKTKSIMQKRLIGIYLVSNFLGSGMCDYAIDENEELYLFITINPECLRHSISDWLTKREMSCFIKNDKSEIGIKVDCGDKYSGLMYILLHESAHLTDYIQNHTPYTELGTAELGRKKSETPFEKSVWIDYSIPVVKYNFPLRDKITFYGFGGGPKIDLTDAQSLYMNLDRTPFPTLYAAMNWAEDFAENITWYYYTRILKQPFTISVSRNGEDIVTYSPMDEDRVKERFPILDELVR
jgi:hypothetical protein